MGDAFKEDIKRRVRGCILRLGHIIKNHFRGLVGCLGAIIIFAIWARPFERDKLHESVAATWAAMFWFVLWQPVSIQATGLIPIFAIPMMGIISSGETCVYLFNEVIILMFTGNWLLMLLNCSGIDKRVACFFLNYNDSYSTASLVAKTMMAGFFLSMISNRLIVAPLLMDMLIPSLDTLSSLPKNASDNFNHESLKAIICNAIAVSTTLGSICIIHNNLTILQFKALAAETWGRFKTYPDTFNYLQYSAFAFPTAIFMFIVNLLYHIILANRYKMSTPSMLIIKKSLTKSGQSVGKWNCHQWLSVFFFVLSTICFFTRWSRWLGMGWGSFSADVNSPQVPGTQDATTAAIFVLILHLLPKTTNFLKECTVRKVKAQKQSKQESGLLFWKTIDKNTDYALFFILGGGIVIIKAAEKTGLDTRIQITNMAQTITTSSFSGAMFLLLLITVIGANIINRIGWQAVLMPFVMFMARGGQNLWPVRTYLVLLGVGIGCTFGFMAPFRHTTMYYTKHTAHVPLKSQMKYGFASVLICFFILWLTICFFAPLLWEPAGLGVGPVFSPEHYKTTNPTSPTTKAP